MQDNQDASGLMYRRNRLYDPKTGRFTQEDPIGLAGGVNAYGFAAGDPVTYDDPFGLCPPLEACLASAKEAGKRFVAYLGSDEGRQLIDCIAALYFCSAPAPDMNALAAERTAAIAGAVVPSVSDQKLRNIVRDLYRGATTPAPTGTDRNGEYR